ncbi:MAG: hypothetical protein IPN86_15605 [Saprospiraceae bacterium]|nr:hypothetical protein [Saprospiraceae bacterium]
MDTGTDLKIGKADADRTTSEGFPVRAKASERSAQKTNPGATVSIISDSKRKTTTGKMKEFEAKEVIGHRANGNKLPLNRERDKRYQNGS